MPKKDEKHPSIEILVHSDILTLKGTGVDVAPALLQGQVALNLVESTPVKHITLQFRGKARLPPPSNDISFGNSAMTYVVCNHEWSFLEGEKKHSHTLKAGRHLFPFQLRLGGSLPSTLFTGAFGGASIAYKLRAVATRPGFAHNLQAQKAITLMRSFAPEALEYQQSLEIENTWPEKLMYSIMIPHKAWAAGDNLTALVKLSPLAKGVRVMSISTTITETVKVFVRTGWQESKKAMVTAKHEIHNGQAVCVDHQHHRARWGLLHHSGARSTYSVPGSPGTATPLHSADLPHSSAPLSHQSFSIPTQSSGSSSESHARRSSETGPSTSPPQGESGSLSHPPPNNFELSEQDIVTKIAVSLPVSATPTHGLEPIITTHRIRWSILITNLDGHTSELRCSLPVHILDPLLLDESKSATATTRRLLLGGPEVSEEQNEDLELPSYPAHVRDRVANMYLPEQAVFRVTNPWIHQGISPVQVDSHRDLVPASGAETPLEAYHVSSPLGQVDSGLEYVNSELLLSLSHNAPPPLETNRDASNPSPPETIASSGSASRRASRVPSRAASPEPHSRRSSESNSPKSPDHASSTFVHAHSTASRNLHGLFSSTMKPFTSLTSSFGLPSRHHGATAHAARATQPSTPPPRPIPVTSHSLLHRAFTEVPDYDIASRGFLGGVPPLESMQGLPSYEASEGAAADAQRPRSAPDLAAHDLEPQPGRSVAAES
ncbi:hypothetical protein BC834DRAFT_842114 [Gloeopeniophorella convolvens]|nr:hypothetical protein BC834DRAFT_842114 [Gloeopeniophorella convolvens]